MLFRSVFFTLTLVLSIQFSRAQVLKLDPLPGVESEEYPQVQGFDDKGNPFDGLEAIFDQGQLPDYREMKGMHSGRCYYRKKPALPTAALLVATQQKADLSKGPFFGPQGLENRFSFVGRKGVKPDFFDSLSDFDLKEIETYQSSSSFLSLQMSEWNSSWIAIDSVNAVGFAVKKSGLFWIGEIFYARPQSSLKNQIEDVRARCYFFKSTSNKH